MIGACYLHHGFEVTAAATVAAFADEIEIASERLLDFKSALQERLARDGRARKLRGHRRVRARRTTASSRSRASVNGEVVGQGSGRSKKAAEQAAAEQALEGLG